MLKGEKYRGKKNGDAKKKAAAGGPTQNANHQFAYKFFHVSFPSFLQCKSCPGSVLFAFEWFVFDGIRCASGTNVKYTHIQIAANRSRSCIVYSYVRLRVDRKEKKKQQQQRTEETNSESTMSPIPYSPSVLVFVFDAWVYSERYVSNKITTNNQPASHGEWTNFEYTHITFLYAFSCSFLEQLVRAGCIGAQMTAKRNTRKKKTASPHTTSSCLPACLPLPLYRKYTTCAHKQHSSSASKLYDHCIKRKFQHSLNK